MEDEDSTDGMETAETGSTQETGNCSPLFLFLLSPFSSCFLSHSFLSFLHSSPTYTLFKVLFPLLWVSCVSLFFQPSHPPSSRVRERVCLSSEAVPMINKITMWSPELIFFPSCAVNLTQTLAGRGGAFKRLGRPHSLSRIDEIFARLHMAPLSSSN